MKKKLTAVALIVCMLAIMLVGASLAYFTDDAEVTNTMTIGNVEIEIKEWTYKDGAWKDFKNNEFTLYPIENEQGAYLYNKSVRTYNISSSEDEAYVRSIVLIEANTKLDYTRGDTCCFPGIHVAHDINAPYTSSKDGKIHHGAKVAETLGETVTINGKEYWVNVYVEAEGAALGYKEALSSLHSVYMDKDVTSEQIAGWGEEGEVDIIVFSQGIQTEGLTHAAAMEALGEVNETNLQDWLDAE